MMFEFKSDCLQEAINAIRAMDEFKKMQGHVTFTIKKTSPTLTIELTDDGFMDDIRVI